jgi:hypothetical protein
MVNRITNKTNTHTPAGANRREFFIAHLPPYNVVFAQHGCVREDVVLY